VRWQGEVRMTPPNALLRAARAIRHEAPVDIDLRSWLTDRVDEETAAAVSGAAGVLTFDHDPGRLSAEFVWSRVRRILLTTPPVARYVVGGWGPVIDRLAAHARAVGVRIETSAKVDDTELDRAVANVAQQNQMTLPQLRARLQQQGMPFATFRNNVRDQLMMERVREREVNARIRIGDDEIDALIQKERAAAGKAVQLNIAQILVTLPDGASADQVAQRRTRAEDALARIQRGEAFETVAREVSEDANKAQGGVIGLRPADRLPDVFVDAVRPLKPGQVTPTLLQSGAGFHILKLLAREDGGPLTIQQTRARHILLRVSDQLSAPAATRRLEEFKRQIQAGTKTFEQLARDNSEDASAAAGGDLGWASPGSYVPEFEEVMDKLAPGGISEPVVSRFGVHLIQVMERRQIALESKQLREQARNVLREQKFEAAYLDWIRDLRGRAYVELREPPA